MRPRLIVLLGLPLLMIVLSCSKKEVKPSVQLFTNTDMETGANSPFGWWFNGNGSSAVFVWSNQAYSGTHSLEITSPTSLADVSYWGQSVTQNIPYGSNLTLNVRIKGNVTGAGIAVAIACLNASSTSQAQQFSTTQGTYTINGNFDWTSYTVSLSGVHSDITEIRTYLMLLPDAAGTAYFDDVTLTAN